MEFLKKNGLTLLSLALSAVLLCVMLEQNAAIGDLRNQLNSQYQDLDGTVQTISDRVSRSMEEATRVVSDYAVTSAGLDRENDALLVDVSVKLRTFGADTAVSLTLSPETGTEQQLALRAGEAGVYTAQISLPLSEAQDDLRVQALVSTAGVTTREDLYNFNLNGLLPIQCTGWGGQPVEMDNGKLRLSEDWFVDLSVPTDAAVLTPEFRLYRNDRLVQTKTAASYLTDGEPATYRAYYMGEWDGVDGAEGDRFALRFACADDTGLSYEFTLQCWVVQDGFAVEDWQESEQFPRLS